MIRHPIIRVTILCRVNSSKRRQTLIFAWIIIKRRNQLSRISRMVIVRVHHAKLLKKGKPLLIRLLFLWLRKLLNLKLLLVRLLTTVRRLLSLYVVVVRHRALLITTRVNSTMNLRRRSIRINVTLIRITRRIRLTKRSMKVTGVKYRNLPFTFIRKTYSHVALRKVSETHRALLLFILVQMSTIRRSWKRNRVMAIVILLLRWIRRVMRRSTVTPPNRNTRWRRIWKRKFGCNGRKWRNRPMNTSLYFGHGSRRRI